MRKSMDSSVQIPAPWREEQAPPRSQETPPPPRRSEYYPGNTIKKTTTTSIVTRQRSFKSGRRSSDPRNQKAAGGESNTAALLSHKVDYREFETDLVEPDEPPPPPSSSHKHLKAFSPAKPKMLAKATKVIQDHVKDVTEMTKQSCYSTPNKTDINGTPMKEYNHPVIPNYHNNHHPHHGNGSVIYITDRDAGITYKKGKLLGKGGFARCYELTNTKNNKTYAGKIIPKNIIAKPHQREKIAREIDLHRALRHRNVVLFHSSFEDDDNVYIILENCSRKSLVHVMKARQTLTEPEVRYYMRQLVQGCQYLHAQHIIHRDLKLGNMLINDQMHTKIADFGLATRVEYQGEKKMTVCGTPNYIAPEVLQKKGHSYEADIWAMGCIMYAMLVGRPPFETSTLKETYVRITANKYFIPGHVSKAGKALIQKLLHPVPDHRPTLTQILSDDFFSAGFCPRTLPTACCHSVPKFPAGPPRPKSFAAPVSPSDAMSKITSSLAHLKGSKKAASQIIAPVDEQHQHHGTPLIHVPHTPGREGNGAGGIAKVPSETDMANSNSALNHAMSSMGGSRDLLHNVVSATAVEAIAEEENAPYNYHSPQNTPDQGLQYMGVPAGTPNKKAASSSSLSSSSVPKSNPKEPLQEVDLNVRDTASSAGGGERGGRERKTAAQQRDVTPMSVASSPAAASSVPPPPPYTRQTSAEAKGASAIRLYQMLSSVLDQLPPDSCPSPVQSSKPLWVTKWVDYSNKYGFGFQLSDKSCGVLFNDTTRMFLAADGRTILYNDLSNRVYTLRADSVPQEYHQKSTLLVYFAQYMDEHLIHGGDMLQAASGSSSGATAAAAVALPASAGVFMKKWFRTSKAIVMYLSNGTLQVNFFDDHTKVVLSPSEGQDYLVTYINSQRQAVSYRLLQFRHFGCHADIATRLSYARRELENIINITGEAV